MSNKNVIGAFVAGILLMLAAFWAGLNVIRNRVPGPSRGEGGVSLLEQQNRPNGDQVGADPGKSAVEAGAIRYVVQVAAFGTDVQADKLTGDLRKKYHSAYTQSPITGKEDTLYRVNIGPYDTREPAEQVASELSSEGRKGVTIIQRTKN